jgi:hypothetical protein
MKTPGIGTGIVGDQWSEVDPSLGDPFVGCAAVTKSDATVLAITRAIYVGTGGDVAVTMAAGGAAVTFKNVASGTFLWLRASKVMSTNTTAADMVACY